MRVWAPEAIASQPPSCAGVGAAKLDSNHVRVASVNRSSAIGAQ